MELSERCIQTLEKEGFTHVYERSEAPDTTCPERSHQDKVTIFISEGSLQVDIAGEQKALRAGERINIPPNTPHSVVVGPDGCQLVIGEMVEGDSWQ